MTWLLLKLPRNRVLSQILLGKANSGSRFAWEGVNGDLASLTTCGNGNRWRWGRLTLCYYLFWHCNCCFHWILCCDMRDFDVFRCLYAPGWMAMMAVSLLLSCLVQLGMGSGKWIRFVFVLELLISTRHWSCWCYCWCNWWCNWSFMIVDTATCYWILASYLLDWLLMNLLLGWESSKWTMLQWLLWGEPVAMFYVEIDHCNHCVAIMKLHVATWPWLHVE